MEKKREKESRREKNRLGLVWAFALHTSMYDCGSKVELSDNFHVPSVCYKLKLLLPVFSPSKFSKVYFYAYFRLIRIFVHREKFRDWSLIVINSQKDFFLLFTSLIWLWTEKNALYFLLRCSTLHVSCDCHSYSFALN